jgi:signal peptidase complex subunit 2
MFALVWDYLNPFPLSRPVLIACVVSYFILMTILTIYTTFVEKGIFLKAIQTDPTGVDNEKVHSI